MINGHENAVSFLLNAFTPDMLDLADREQGQTALHKAVQTGNRNICTMLAIRGATLSVKDKQGRSAQELAHFLGQHDLAATLTRKWFPSVHLLPGLGKVGLSSSLTGSIGLLSMVEDEYPLGHLAAIHAHSSAVEE